MREIGADGRPDEGRGLQEGRQEKPVHGAPHRGDALDACHFLIDWLKTEAPFWKLEETPDGDGHWVDARDSDTAATAKWR